MNISARDRADIKALLDEASRVNGSARVAKLRELLGRINRLPPSEFRGKIVSYAFSTLNYLRKKG